MYPCSLSKIMHKFETKGKLGNLTGKGQKEIMSSDVEIVASTVVETKSHSLHGRGSMSDASV